MIDLKSLLSENGTRYWEFGKNCSPGFINIRCIYCNDKSNHLGIKIKNGDYNCWKCGAKDDLINLLQDLYEIKFIEAKKLIRKYRTGDEVKSKRVKNPHRDFQDIIPKEATVILPAPHRKYIIGRRFDPDVLQKKYQLYACHLLGKFKWRIVIPIIFQGKIVNFTAITVVGAEPKAKNCPNEKAIIDRNELLYNYDSIVNRRAIVVEGPADVWRMGDECVGILTTNFTMAQVNLLVKACDEVYIMLDSKAKDPQAPKQALKLANQLTGLIRTVEILDLKSGDPADLTDKEALKIRKEIGFNS